MHEMRRQDRKMDEVQARKILEECEYGVLATADNSGQPYAVPVNYVLVGNDLYFHCATEGHKLDNLTINSKVCFTVVGGAKLLPERFSTAYESVIVYGTAGIVGDEEKTAALKALVGKYSPGYIPQGDVYIDKAKDKTKVVKIAITRLTGKHRGD
jgi:nitroimidazol reductase NimA-like FMN-containing flavoprotein (pyridoxamine 5'-phosphate oxidase superfamily)